MLPESSKQKAIKTRTSFSRPATRAPLRQQKTALKGAAFCIINKERDLT